jgi:hypothetical protein
MELLNVWLARKAEGWLPKSGANWEEANSPDDVLARTSGRGVVPDGETREVMGLGGTGLGGGGGEKPPCGTGGTGLGGLGRGGRGLYGGAGLGGGGE